MRQTARQVYLSPYPVVNRIVNRSDIHLRAAVQQMNLSARAYHRILKLARTIADLAGEEQIAVPHLAEALQYRPRGMG